MYGDWGVRTIASDVIIERIKSIVVTTYDGGDLHILDVRAIELQQALEADTYL